MLLLSSNGVAEPVQALIETLTGGCARALDVPLPLPQRVQAELCVSIVGQRVHIRFGCVHNNSRQTVSVYSHTHTHTHTDREGTNAVHYREE